jgi:hypothetical protein
VIVSGRGYQSIVAGEYLGFELGSILLLLDDRVSEVSKEATNSRNTAN